MRRRRARRRQPNPRFDRSLPRSGRIPLTLIDGSSVANAARDLRVLAASIHAHRPCWAQILQRYATQIAQGYTAAAAVAAMTEKPNATAAVAERVFAERSLSERAVAETTFEEPPL